MAKAEDDGSWIFQVSMKNASDAMVNIRGKNLDEFAHAREIFKIHGAAFGFDVENAASNKPPERKSYGGGGFKKNYPASTAPAPAASADAKDAGNGLKVVTGKVKTVFNGNVGRSGKMGPGTIVLADGVKYDTFSDSDIAEAREALAKGATVNVMYSYSEQYKRNTIVEDGFSTAPNA